MSPALTLNLFFSELQVGGGGGQPSKHGAMLTI